MPWWAILGCAGRTTLDQVEIRGATPAEERVIRQELVAFDQQVGPGRLTIPVVVVRTPSDRESDGEIDRHTGKIQLEAGLAEARIREVVRHELCHALDFAEDLTADGSPAAAFAAPLAAWLRDPYILDAPDWYQEAEAFAWACGVGPHAAAAIAEPCPGESDELGPLFRWLRDTVWQGPAGRLEPVTIGAPTPFALDAEGEDLSVFMYSEPAQTLGLRLAPQGTSYLVDRTSGDVVAVGRLGQEAPREECELGEFPDDVSVARYGTDAGPAIIIAWFERFYLDKSAGHWFGRQGAEPFGFGGCVPPGIYLDAGEGEIWAGWIEEGEGVYGELSVDR